MTESAPFVGVMRRIITFPACRSGLPVNPHGSLDGRIPPEPYCRAVSSHVTPKLPGIFRRFRRFVRPSAIMRMVLHGNAWKCHVGDDLGGVGGVLCHPCVFMHNRAETSVPVCVPVTFNALLETAEFQRSREGVPVPGNIRVTWPGTEAAATRPERRNQPNVADTASMVSARRLANAAAYVFSVVVASSWPIRSWRVFTSAPLAMATDANVCRRE